MRPGVSLILRSEQTGYRLNLVLKALVARDGNFRLSVPQIDYYKEKKNPGTNSLKNTKGMSMG